MRAIRKLWNTLTLALLILFTAAISPVSANPAAAAIPSERILNYDINAVIDKNAKMTVTERITVLADNKKIKHGIYRTYPTKMRIGTDGLYKFGFKLLSAKLDGKDVKHKETESGIMEAVLLGDAQNLVPKGQHTYEIIYETTGHVRSLDDHDEIYYNAIGLDVLFPIDKATFSLTLPDSTKPLLTKAYTGKDGEHGADYRMTGDMAFETTRMLKPHEAFTVVVGWKKGVVTIPDDQAWASTHRTEALLICIGIVLIILALGWYKNFRKRFKGVAYPVFTPPEDLSPGMAAYLDKFKATPLMLQADLIWSAINGYCTIDMKNPKGTVFNWSGKTTTQRCFFCPEQIPIDAEICPKCGKKVPDSKKRKGNARLAKDADTLAGKIANVLFSVVDTIVLGFEDSKKHRAHNSLIGAWQRLYDNYMQKVKDFTDMIFGKALTALIIGQLMLLFFLGDIWYDGLANSKPTTVFEMFYLPALPAIFAVGMVVVVFIAIKSYPGNPAMRYGVCAVAVILFLCASILLWLLVGDAILTITYLLLWGLPILFWCKWHEVPSKTAKEKLQIIEGLKMYINTAEKHRLEAINAPEDSVTQYETILPYAIALGCAEAWEKRYAPILAEVRYEPTWIETDTDADNETIADIETWDERRWRIYYEQKEREMINAIIMPGIAGRAIENAIARSEQTRSKISKGGGRGGWTSGGPSSRSGSRSGSAGGGSGGGGVGGW